MTTLNDGEKLTLTRGAGTKEVGPVALTAGQTISVTGGQDPAPPPPPPPPSVTTNILGVDFASRPKTGAAWDRMKSAAGAAGAVTLTDTAGTNNGELLALAFVAAANNDSLAKSKVVSLCKAALNGAHARTLEQARNLAPIAIALDVIGSIALDAELKRERDFVAADQGSVVTCHEHRPNNWGTASGLARIAVSAHLKDTADLAKAVVVHKGWLGDRTSYAGFAYGDMSWQLDSTKPVGINVKGATKSSIIIDGVLPDDQRRASAFPTWVNENYVWQALGEVAGTQFILRASGYPDAFGWSDAAVARAYVRYNAHNFGAANDDGWQYAAAAAHGVTIAHTGFAPGKSFGWADWLYG